MVVTHRRSADLGQGRRVLANATRVLVEVEELDAGATGALVFGARDRAAGAVLVERGRVCWVGANGLQRRLTDLLLQQTRPAPDRRLVERLFQECRRDGRPLGERLVEAGVVAPEGLRRALLEHSTEALAKLCATDTGRRLWVPHRARRYDAAFTFAPAELSSRLCEHVVPEKAASGQRELAEILAGEGIGVAVDRDGDVAAPLVVAHAGDSVASMGELVELARWSAGALDLGEAIAGGSRLVSASRADGASLLAWTRDGLLFGAACAEASVGACVVARHSRRWS